MSTRQVCCAIIALTLFLGSCSSEKIDSEITHLGGCILVSPSSEVPRNLYQESDVVPTAEYKPFTKKISVYGITLIGRVNITDTFMRNVAKTIKEMFPQGEGIDSDLQKEVLRNMYRYRVVIPLFKVNPGFDSEEDWVVYQNMKRQNSVCDIIIEDEPGRQVMEVIEHILHHVTNVGLHYTFPDEWGISKSSKLYQFMLQAVDKGYYDDTSYDGIDEEETRLRVKLQELAYIIITTAWDLQEPYGEGGNEWTRGGTIISSDDLKAQCPEAYKLYVETVTKVMAAPSPSLLDQLFGS